MTKMSRRNFISALLLSAVSIKAFATARIPTASPGRADDKSSRVKVADGWMKKYLEFGGREVTGALSLRRFRDPMYILLSPISWTPPEGSPLGPVSVPTGFVTDFASVPRVFWSFFRPDGDYAYAATVHDYLYWVQDRTIEDANRIFLDVMSEMAIRDSEARLLHKAVDLFGKSAWDENARLQVAGEKRVLTQFPEDPRLTWAEWKRKPGVFDAPKK